jgi:polysaccharide biosynthesis/export protein
MTQARTFPSEGRISLVHSPRRGTHAALKSHAAGRRGLPWPVTPSLLTLFLLPFFLLALASRGAAQTTLQTPVPAQDDAQCRDRDCTPDAATEDNSGTNGAAEAGAGNVPRLPAMIAPKNPPGGQLPGKEEQSKEGQYLTAMPPKWGLLPPKIPEPPTEFQQFVAASLGRKLPLYGHNLFDHVPTTFAPLDRVPVTDDYVIGPGDEILVRAWGQIEMNAKLVVDREGEVFLPKVGQLSVAGLQYQQLSDYFRTAIGRVFRNFDLTVSLGELRSIQVFVVGQARRPGSYTVSSLCTLVNALFASGGPSNSGSMRRIQLKRENRVLVEFDFYDLLLRGDKSKDARLLPGDVIYIPPAGPSIAVAGSVNLPGIYELRAGPSPETGDVTAAATGDLTGDDTNLAGAIEMAGGLSSVADGGKAVVERVDHHESRSVEEFPLDGEGMKRVLKDGDIVRIFPLSPRFLNAVTLRGNVAHPGRFEWHDGMCLRDVIPDQLSLITREYWSAANAAGNGGDLGRQLGGDRQTGGHEPASQRDGELARQALDGRDDGREDGREDTSAAANASLPATPTAAKLRAEMARNAPEINWDYAVIQRLNPVDLTTRLVPFNLGKLVLERDEASNLRLEPGDIITIFSQNDLAVPLAKRSKFVRLEGEFRAAGIYRAEPGETVRHLVARAGGFTANAYLYGAEFTRESVRREQQKGLDALIENLEEDITHNALAPAGVNPDEAADQRARLETQRQMVARLRAIAANGRVVLDLKPDSNSVADLPEIAVEDGDRFVVPYRSSTVEVLGAVYNKNSFLYQRTGRLDDYLKRAGGPTREADPARMFVIRADGSILSRQSVKGFWDGGFASLRLMPGDAIVVPERLSHGAFLRGLRDWSQVFSQFALGAAAVRVIQ